MPVAIAHDQLLGVQSLPCPRGYSMPRTPRSLRRGLHLSVRTGGIFFASVGPSGCGVAGRSSVRGGACSAGGSGFGRVVFDVAGDVREASRRVAAVVFLDHAVDPLEEEEEVVELAVVVAWERGRGAAALEVEGVAHKQRQGGGAAVWEEGKGDWKNQNRGKKNDRRGRFAEA